MRDSAQKIPAPRYESADLREELELVLNDVSVMASQENKKTGFCIGNTTKKIDRDYFFTPIRNTARCVCGSLIIDRVSIAEEIVSALDGRVDYLFIDTEKKISPERYGRSDAGNVERAVRRIVKKSRVLTYKANDLIVDAMDSFLAQKLTGDERGVGAKKIAIIGVGNTGFKLALKLMERGAHVFVVRRNAKKLSAIVKALNLIKPEGTIARIRATTSIQKAITDADVVIGLTPGTGDITAPLIRRVKPAALLIDAGKGSFSKEAVEEAERLGMFVYRSHIIASFEGQVAMLLKMEELMQQAAGRATLHGVPLIAGGIVGKKGEIVVDDLWEPTQIYGIADGAGDFNRSPNREEILQIAELARLLQEKKLAGAQS